MPSMPPPIRKLGTTKDAGKISTGIFVLAIILGAVLGAIFKIY